MNKALLLSVAMLIVPFLSGAVRGGVCQSTEAPEKARAAASKFASRVGAKHARMRGAHASRRARRAMRPQGVPTGRARTFIEDGKSLFHVIEFEGGGFVTVSADDASAQVIGFSPSGEMPDDSPSNPFWTLASRTVRAASSLSALSAGSATKIASEAGLDDVRVEPLVQSKWDQTTAGGKNTYNYYTPNNWYCGCVATAMAQLMRFHGYPVASIEAQTFTCTTNDVAVELTMKGGVYDWDSMPYVPDSSTSDAEREAIGRICYDAGVAVRMQYGKNSSGAYGEAIALALKDVFGFANAQYAYPADSDDFAAAVQDAILTNLDAGYPVILGISATNAGHAILADGYGYFDDTLYCHLNMGWSGSDDYWYALPNIKAGGYNFTTLDGIAYNIFPDFTGEIASGRVTDPSGAPIAGAQIAGTAVYRRTAGSGSGRAGKPSSARYVTYPVSAVTDEHGIYAVFVPAGQTNTVSLTATRDGWTTAPVSTNVVAALSPREISFEADGLYGYWDTSIGSRWGNDIVFGSYGGAEAVIGAFSSVAPARGGGASAWGFSVSGTPGAWYAVEGTESLNPAAWTVVTNAVLPRTGVLTVELPAAGDAASMFYRAIAK